MTDFLPPDLQPFAGVVGLALLFVAVSAVIQRYRAWQVEKLARAQRLLHGAGRIVAALDRLAGLPLPREAGTLFGQELVARYRAVRVLFPRFEGIDERIGDAESRLRAAGGGTGWEVPPLGEREQLDHYTAGLTGLVGVLQEEHLEIPLESQVVRGMRERLRTLRAEARYGFVTRAARAAAERGEWKAAQQEVLLLLGFLKQKAPPNDRGKTLYLEARELYGQLQARALGEAVE